MKNTKTLKQVLSTALLIALLVLSTVLNINRLQTENMVHQNYDIQIENVETEKSNTYDVLALLIAIGSTLGISFYGIYTCKVKGNEIIRL